MFIRKPTLLTATLIVLSIITHAQHKTPIPQIDHRVELLNIIYHLATAASPADYPNTYYITQVNNHFQNYRAHPAITFTRDLISKHQQEGTKLTDWELPSLAVHLTQPPELMSRVINSPGNDGWDDRTLLSEAYITLIRDFYIQSKADQFFVQQQPYFDAVQRAYKRSGKKVNTQWLAEYINLPPTETYHPLFSLTNNSGAYLRVNFTDNKRDTHTLFGCDTYNDNGIPQCFNHPYFEWAILHESIHCFTNQLIDSDTITYKQLGEKLLAIPDVRDRVKNTFYGNWRYLMYESLVRAMAIRYAIANGTSHDKITADIEAQQKAGFIWMGDLVKELERYEKNRDRYKTMREFMPEVVSVLERHLIVDGDNRQRR